MTISVSPESGSADPSRRPVALAGGAPTRRQGASPAPAPVLTRIPSAHPVGSAGAAGGTRPVEGDDPGEAAGTPPTMASVPGEDAGAWCGTLVRAAVETLAGTRPAAQLARWVSADLYDSISRRAGLAVRIHGRPSLVRQAVVRSVRVCRISPLVAEASVVVHDGVRLRAAAIRVEAHRGRWRATALEIG